MIAVFRFIGCPDISIRDSLREWGQSLRDHSDDLALLQYVPHAYSYKAVNLPFCLWLNALQGMTKP